MASGRSAAARPRLGLAILSVTLANLTRAAGMDGYLDDTRCAACHGSIARAYRDVGMAKSFGPAASADRIEDFGTGPFVHAASGQTLAIVRKGKGLVFRRFTRGASGARENALELDVDFVLGSGRRARTYLYRTPDGALFQLPLAWYAEERRWAMAPGYDRPAHDGVLRRVRRECLFCHDAYPALAPGADAADRPHVFPADLPHGTGCQRCHGPGAEHERRALDANEPRERVRAAIVNPARLAPARRDDVCAQCHLQPLVALSGARRLGRGDFSFRPGEALADYVALVDAREAAGADADRFEINHHAYRLAKSACFATSGGKLSCRTCHDPHRLVPAAERAAHYRAACRTCHAAATACRRPRDAEASAADVSDCVSCHMPRRRPRDVVHVLMTDHRISRDVGGPAARAPLAETEPELTEVWTLDRARGAEDAELYRLLPVVRAGTSEAALARLERLAAARPEDALLRREVAAGQLRRRKYAEAERTLDALLARAAPDATLLWWLGIARDGRRDEARAEEALRAALAAPGAEAAEVGTRLGQLLLRTKRAGEARELFRNAVAARPNLVAAWVGLGRAEAAMGRSRESARSFARAKAFDPTVRIAGAGAAAAAPAPPP